MRPLQRDLRSIVIFRQTRGPISGAISGGEGPAIPFLLRDKETGKVKININLIKIISNLNKLKRRLKPSERLCAFLPGIYKFQIGLRLIFFGL